MTEQNEDKEHNMAENMGTESTEAVAARCLEDAAFAEQILEGEAHSEVREAIIADLGEDESVKGYYQYAHLKTLNPQPLPPSPPPDIYRVAFRNWATFDRPNLHKIAFNR